MDEEGYGEREEETKTAEDRAEDTSVGAVPTPRPPPQRESFGVPKWVVIAAPVAAGVASVVIWLNSQFSDIKDDVSDLRSKVSSIDSKVDQLDLRIGKLEDRFNAKFGTETDAGVLQTDAGVDAGAITPKRGTEHVLKRMRFCDARCAGVRPSVCYRNCEERADKCLEDCEGKVDNQCFYKCTDVEYGPTDNPWAKKAPGADSATPVDAGP